ncbi:MAG: hypothetical protein IKO48_00355 [Elusimicrobia bacterium]|jgi:hypothetical protein|nr:hypothetical protein [Elusimicrobiota bacterium]
MAKERKDKRSGCLIKIFLFILFIVGIILGFSYLSANKDSLTAIEVPLDNSIVTTLTSNGIEQVNVISQLVEEVKISGVTCNQYHKTIKLPENKKPENFEPLFKTLARNFKIDLSKTKYKDGSYEYTFYDNKRTYSTIILK